MSEYIGDVRLREAEPGDFPVFFAHRGDPEAVRMAAFTSEDPGDLAAFEARWTKMLQKETILNRTIIVGGRAAGSVATYEHEGERELTYWIGRGFWGKGVTTAAVRLLLELEMRRPVFARAAKDNVGSLRVLEKCGFQIIGEDSGFAEARGCVIEEFVLRLDAG